MEDWTIKEVKERLDSIGRLRLLFGSYPELAGLTGFAVNSKNSLSKIGGSNEFIKKAAYSALCEYAEDNTGYDLDYFITSYAEASLFYEKYQLKGIFGKRNRDKCFLLLDCVYGNLTPEDIKDGEISRLVAKMEDISIPLLILLVIRVLPPYHRGRGDVKDIDGDFRTLFEFMRRYFYRDLSYLPVIDQCEHEVFSDPAIKTRFYMYVIFNECLQVYTKVVRTDRLYMNSVSVRGRLVRFDLPWLFTQDVPGEWWRFEMLVNGYLLYRYTVHPEVKRVDYEKYEFIMYHEDDMITGVVLHPDYLFDLIKGKAPQKDFMDCFFCEMDDEGDPQWISFTPAYKNSWLKVYKLKRSPRTLDDFKGYTFHNLHGSSSYNYVISLSAITEQYLYIKCEEGGYYRVPKSLDPVLEEITFEDSCGILTIEQSRERFVSISECNLFLCVTTYHDREKYGIRIVEGIEPEGQTD